jgi:hypothetical protein
VFAADDRPKRVCTEHDGRQIGEPGQRHLLLAVDVYADGGGSFAQGGW